MEKEKESAKWDAEAVAAEASAKLVAEGGAAGVEAGRSHFIESLFAWEDEASSSSHESSQIDAIVELWLRYASFERSLKQFKKAVQVFESALASPLASRSPRLWLEYALFCQERNKVENANYVFQRAVESLPEDESLWDAFLEFRTKTLNENITLEQLKYGDNAPKKEDDAVVVSEDTHDSASRKRPREENKEAPPELPKTEDTEPGRKGKDDVALIDFTSELPTTSLSNDDREIPKVFLPETEEAPDKTVEEDAYDPIARHDTKQVAAVSLFGPEPISENEPKLDGLDAAQTQAFIRFVREPTAIDLVEALRLTDMLATAEIEETWAALRYHQASRLRAAANKPEECIALVAAIQNENDSLTRRTATELNNIHNDIFSALQNAGLPMPADLHLKRRIVRAVLASNLRNKDTTTSHLRTIQPPTQPPGPGAGFPGPQPPRGGQYHPPSHHYLPPPAAGVLPATTGPILPSRQFY